MAVLSPADLPFPHLNFRYRKAPLLAPYFRLPLCFRFHYGKKPTPGRKRVARGGKNSRKIPPFPSGLTAPLPHREGQAVAAVAEAYAIFRHAPASSRATRAVPLPWNSGGRRSQRRRRRRAARSSPPPFFPRSDSFLFFRLERLCCVI